jgi:hypothetical protein
MGRRDPKHLRWIREQSCCVPKCTNGVIHAHHVRGAHNAGTGLKPPDYCTVPLCSVHHHEIHVHGAKTFEAVHDLDLRVVAAFMAEVSGQEMP